MGNLKHAAFIALFGISSAAQAQDFPVMDWGPIMQTEAMNSVIEEIGRSEARRAGLPYPNDADRAQPAMSVRASMSRSLGEQIRGGATNSRAVEAGYTPSPAVRQELAGIMSQAAAKEERAKGEEMRQLVLSG